MQQDSASFWAEIKACEEQLVANPDSFCFARLAEVYLKVGLVDDALHVARQGTARHPGYVQGLRILAMASQAKGLVDECRSALERVTAAMPEDRDAQMTLGRMYAAAGFDAQAQKVFRTILEFVPGDTESRDELDAFERRRVGVAAGSVMLSTEESGEEILEELEILEAEELEVVEEEISEDLESEHLQAETVATPHHDPLSTTTLAELYVSQGFVAKALDIFRTLLAADPANVAVSSRIAELEAAQVQQKTAPAPDVVSFADQPGAFADTVIASSSSVTAASSVPVRGSADDAVAVLEGWLDTIRRIRACR